MNFEKLHHSAVNERAGMNLMSFTLLTDNTGVPFDELQPSRSTAFKRHGRTPVVLGR